MRAVIFANGAVGHLEHARGQVEEDAVGRRNFPKGAEVIGDFQGRG